MVRGELARPLTAARRLGLAPLLRGFFLAPELAPDKLVQGRIRPYGGCGRGMKKGGNLDISALSRTSQDNLYGVPSPLFPLI